jgi:hemerythrin-like domain-containing protein
MTGLLADDAAAPGFDDPLGMLRACHRRIERQLATLDRLVRHLPAHGCDAAARAAAAGILRYFDMAAPHHHADEEESVFPRLLAAAPAAGPLVARLEAEHGHLAETVAQVRPALVALAAGEPAALPEAWVAAMAAAYGAHIAVEETALLPLAQRALDAATLALIGGEMAARRGVDPRTLAPRDG